MRGESGRSGALERSREDLDLACEIAQLGQWELDPQTLIVRWDARCSSLWALPAGPPAELERVLSQIHPDDVATVRAAVHAALDPAGDGRINVEYRTAPSGADGPERWLMIRGAATFERGAPVRFAGVAQEITALRVAERARREGELRLAALVQSTAVVLWTADAQGALVLDSSGWRELTGQSFEAWRGRGWLDAVPEKRRAAVARAWDAAMAARETFELELVLQRRDGGSLRAMLRGVPALDHVARPSWFGTFSDVTESRRALRDLELLSQAGPALAASLEPQQTFETLVNLVVPAFADRAAVHVRDEDGLRLATALHRDPLRTPLVDLLHASAPFPDDWPHHHLHVLRTGESQLLERDPVGEFGALGMRGPGLWLLTHELGLQSSISVPLRFGDQIFGAINFMRDADNVPYERADLALAEEIGRRAALAMQNGQLYSLVRRERDLVEEANRAKDEFLAVVSHELRTPLTSMLGWTRLLRAGNLDAAKQARALETIERNAHAQTQLIEDLLDVSRIITGKLRLNVRASNLAHVVGQALDALRPAAEAKQIALDSALAPLEAPFYGDPDRIQQAIWNLLSNAIKFTPAGGKVSVTLRGDSARATLQVSDTGRGISADFLPHVFERFRQADPSLTRAHGGLGLGLAIVRHVVELHGGTVRAESRGAGEGAVLTIELPLARRDAAGEGGAVGAPLVYPPELRGVRVLVVDDEADTREMLRTTLEAGGVLVHTASTAAEALDALQSGWAQLLVSDVGMPGEDGHALIRAVRQAATPSARNIPAVALTAYARLQDRTRALAAGFDVHAPKPVEPAELVEVVAALARRLA